MGRFKAKADYVKYMKKKYGDDYFRRIGKKGGAAGWRGKGFASELISKSGLKLDGAERARIAGSRGGKKSKRGPQKHWW